MSTSGGDTSYDLDPNILNSVRTYNTIAGLYQLNMVNSTTLMTDIHIEDKSLEINNSTDGAFQIAIIETKYCPGDNPYLEKYK